MLAIDGIRDADAALEHLAALSRLSRLSIAQASQLSAKSPPTTTAASRWAPFPLSCSLQESSPQAFTSGPLLCRACLCIASARGRV